MFSPRSVLALVLTACCVNTTAAQMKDDKFDYRRLLAPPKTTPEFWEALLFELEVGRADLAAAHLSTMLGKPPTRDELVELHRKEGMAAFLRLRLVPKWSDDRAAEQKARADVEAFIKQVSDAVFEHLNNPTRIRAYVNNLYGLPEESAFARIELTRSGTAAVPLMIEEMERRDITDRQPIVDALTVMKHDAMLPLLAALDSSNNNLRENVLDVLRKRRDLYSLRFKGVEVAPPLWYLLGRQRNDRPSAAVIRKAREVLAIVLDLRSPDHLPLIINELTAEAERYYYRRVRFDNESKVSLWQWDGVKVVENSKYNRSTAEEYLGLRFARQALEIKETHRPAMILVLSLLIDKSYQSQADRPVGALKASVEELLLKMDAELLNATLEQALSDGRVTVILGTLRALGKIGDPRALKPLTQGEPAIVRALHFGDARVSVAAADALLRIPGSASVAATTRIIEIFKTALIPEALAATAERPRILVASAQERLTLDLRRSAETAGYDPLIVTSGRQALKRLLERSDVGAILLDSTLPEPGLTSTLGQLRADSSLKRLPVFVIAVPDGDQTRLLLEQLNDVRGRLRALEDELRPRLEERARQARLETIAALREAGNGDPVIDKLRQRKKALEDDMVRLGDRFEVTATEREKALRQHLEKLQHVWVLSAQPLREARLLAARLEERIREAGVPPLTKAEQKENLETALYWLAKLAVGDVPGFEVKAAEQNVVAIVRTPGLGEEQVKQGVRVLGRLSGSAAQKELIALLLDRKRPIGVRSEAAEELRRHFQEFGFPDVAQQQTLLAALELEMKQPPLKEEKELRDRLQRFVGVLRPGERTTGQRLRDFRP